MQANGKNSPIHVKGKVASGKRYGRSMGNFHSEVNPPPPPKMVHCCSFVIVGTFWLRVYTLSEDAFCFAFGVMSILAFILARGKAAFVRASQVNASFKLFSH